MKDRCALGAPEGELVDALDAEPVPAGLEPGVGDRRGARLAATAPEREIVALELALEVERLLARRAVVSKVNVAVPFDGALFDGPLVIVGNPPA